MAQATSNGEEFEQQPNEGAVHVVHLKVVGLSGILLDSATTKATVSRNKDMLIPPRQMKATLAVVRDNNVYGVSPNSKRLSRASTVPSILEEKGQDQQLQEQPQQKRPLRRYIAVWDNSTIIATASSTGEIVSTTADSTILFETTLSADHAAPTTFSPHKNLELIVGLSPDPTVPVKSDAVKTIPIGVATLPINEAAALRGSSGKVILDLPIFNVSPQEVNEKASPFTIPENKNDDESRKGKTIMKRNMFSLLRRKKVVKMNSEVLDVKHTKQACIYTLDTSSNDAAMLRVELEIHEKESNVEIGLSSMGSDSPLDTRDNDWQSEKVVVVEDISKDLYCPAIETSTHSTPLEYDNDCIKSTIYSDAASDQFEATIRNYMEELSVERVLSIRGSKYPPMEKPKFKFSPTRRFRVNCIDRDSYGTSFELKSVCNESTNKEKIIPTNVPVKDIFIDETQLESLSSEHENDTKTRLFDVAIERILSSKETHDIFSDDLRRFDGETTKMSYDIPFDEQSFLSRDTTAFTPTKKNRNKQLSSVPIVETVENVKFRPFWARIKKRDKVDKTLTTVSVTGTESSNHSISNVDSDTEAIQDDDDESDPESPELDKTVDDSPLAKDVIPKVAKIPVSILKKPVLAAKAIAISKDDLNLNSATTTSTTIELSDTLEKFDNVSVVSSTADTTVMSPNKPSIDYEQHFNEMLKDLSSAKVPKNDGPDTDTTESVQSSSTNATPPSTKSTYSSPLPSFVEETDQPVIWLEKFGFDDDDILESKVPRKQRLNNKSEETNESNEVAPFVSQQENLSILPRKNMLAQNLYGFIDIQPCTGKLDRLLVPDDDDEEFTLDESWVNENSTIGTYKTRKGTIHDDLADLGLLWGDMCRQTGFRASDDDSIFGTNTAFLDKNKGKQHWMAALGGTVRSPLNDSYRKSKKTRKFVTREVQDYYEVDDGNHSTGSDMSDGSFTDEQTLRSATEESESELSEQGTEVDVNDIRITPKTTIANSATSKSELTQRVLPPILKQNGVTGFSSESAAKTVDHNILESSTNDAQSISGSSGRFSKRWSRPGSDAKVSTDKTLPPVVHSTKAQSAEKIQTLPPKIPRTKVNDPIMHVETPIRANVTKADASNNGSNTDSATPLSMIPPKSIAQSIVDFVEYVISPSPTPSAMIPIVPTILDADDTASIGELTATTYERQVEVDEMKRQSEQSKVLVSNDNEHVDTPTECVPVQPVVVANDNYFSEYDSPAVAAAMEAAAAKQMAES